MRLDIRTNFPDIQRRLLVMQQDVARQATARAINRTIEQAQTAMSREIRREFNVTPQEVNQSLRITRARFAAGVFEMSASLESPQRRGRSLNLIRFVERSVSLAAARKRMAAGEGGTYRLGKAERRKQLELRFKIRKGGPSKVIPGAFIGNKGRTVFIRLGDERLPIKALQTIDIAQMFNAKRINERVVGRMRSDFPRIFEHEAKFYTERFNRSGA